MARIDDMRIDKLHNDAWYYVVVVDGREERVDFHRGMNLLCAIRELYRLLENLLDYL